MMTASLRRGLFAGLLAGVLIALLFFVDGGPGSTLSGAAHWLALASGGTTGKVIGFFLVILLGGVFGLLFGVLQSRGEITLRRSLLLGLATGFVWWLLIVFLIGTVINHQRLDFGSWLFNFLPLLVYGMLLGSLYMQLEREGMRVA